MYFGASTILPNDSKSLSSSYKRPFSKSSLKGKPQETSNGYATLDAIVSAPNTPQTATSSPHMYNTFDHQTDDHHYEHIPGQIADTPEPRRPPSLPADPPAYDSIQQRQARPAAESAKCDEFGKEMKPDLPTGRYGRLNRNSRPAPPPPASDKFNPYVLEPTFT